MFGHTQRVDDNFRKELLQKSELLTTDDLFANLSSEQIYDLQSKIYEAYAKAMQLRGRGPLEKDRFSAHFFEGGNVNEPVTFGNNTDGYLLGNNIDKAFLPTHFAPYTLRGGVSVDQRIA